MEKAQLKFNSINKKNGLKQSNNKKSSTLHSKKLINLLIKIHQANNYYRYNNKASMMGWGTNAAPENFS